MTLCFQIYRVECRVQGYPVDRDTFQLYFYPCPEPQQCRPTERHTLQTAGLLPVDNITDPVSNINNIMY